VQVGCGAGNTIFPLLSTYPDIFVHACDFSPRAVDLVKVFVYLIHNRSWDNCVMCFVLFCLLMLCHHWPNAEWYLQKHKDFRPDRINAFVCDITSEQLTESMEPSCADIVTMVTFYTMIKFWIIHLPYMTFFMHYFQYSWVYSTNN
jgi:methyltransferase-like protein 6